MIMEKKIIFPVLLAVLILQGVFLAQTAQAKTVKKLVVKSIDHEAKTLKAVKNGDVYDISATNAKIRKGSNSSRKTTLAKIREGDVITVEGAFNDKNVTATKIRDLSFDDKKTVTFYGTIDSINEATKTFKINTLDRDKQTISVLDSTKLRNKDGHSMSFSDLKEDDRVFVTGKWSRKNKTITKTKTVDVLDDDDFDELGD